MKNTNSMCNKYLFSLALRFLLADSRRFNIEESDNCKAPTEGNQIDLGVELGVVAGLTAVLLLGLAAPGDKIVTLVPF